MGKNRIILVTGFPGFISHRLLEHLLSMDHDLQAICLVEASQEFGARELARRLGTDGKPGESRVEVVVGDIGKPGLGLGADAVADVTSRITDVLHLAAIYDLSVPEDQARRVNVWGTRHVIDLCRRATRLERFVHFSSCYVSGDRTGRVYEDELNLGQGFKNHYEATKHDAEYLVRQAILQVPTVIVRPSIVVGHESTGETSKFDGPYFGMILVDRLSRLHIPLPYLGPSRAQVNIVPINFVVNATRALWLAEGAVGRTFALADPDPLVARDLYAEIVRGLGALGPMGRVPPLLVDLPLRLATVRRMLGVPRQVLDYFNHEVIYDCANATAELSRSGLSCPDVRSYLPRLIEFYVQNHHRPELRAKMN